MRILYPFHFSLNFPCIFYKNSTFFSFSGQFPMLFNQNSIFFLSSQFSMLFNGHNIMMNKWVHILQNTPPASLIVGVARLAQMDPFAIRLLVEANATKSIHLQKKDTNPIFWNGFPELHWMIGLCGLPKCLSRYAKWEPYSISIEWPDSWDDDCATNEWIFFKGNKNLNDNRKKMLQD